MGKHSTHQKLQVLKAYIEDLHSKNKKPLRQPQWLKEILNGQNK